MILKRFFQGWETGKNPRLWLVNQWEGDSGESNICNFDLRLIVTKK